MLTKQEIERAEEEAMKKKTTRAYGRGRTGFIDENDEPAYLPTRQRNPKRMVDEEEGEEPIKVAHVDS